MREGYNYTWCGIKKNDMKTYYDNMLKEENTALRIANFQNRDGIPKLVACMPDDQALGQWECNLGGSTPRYTQLGVSFLSIPLYCLAIGLDISTFTWTNRWFTSKLH